MTCIVGLVDKGTVYMGADSAALSELRLTLRSDTKVFHNGDFLIGFTSSFRMGQLLRFEFAPPAHPDGINCYAYMVKYFIPAVRQCLKDGGYAKSDQQKESGGCFLVGYKGHLFNIDSDYQVGMLFDDFYSIGGGAQVALGALSISTNNSPKERVLSALKAAERWHAGVRGPFVVESIGE